MRKWYNLPKEEREIMESYTLGAFKGLMKEYRAVKRNYYIFGLIPTGKEISSEDRQKLKQISDKIVTFHGMYSSQHPERVDINTRALETRFSIQKMLGSN